MRYDTHDLKIDWFLAFFTGDLHEAKANFELALEMNSLYEKARSWQRKVMYRSKGVWLLSRSHFGTIGCGDIRC